MLKKPKKLKRGDTVATVSPSWGGAGEPEIKWRYEQGVKRLEEVFGLNVIPMPNSLKGGDYLYENPKARAEDLMTAFSDHTIKAIFANIGGEDSIRLLPYIDFAVIQNNPKIFSGYSDVTISHLFCHKAGISSFYGPAILTDFAENVEMDPYTIEMVNRTLFSNE
uniref:LD-carboxypeptidase n=1 Tax=Sporosarcina ureae TaxID=1571 RepID=UPI0026ECB3B8